MQLCRFRVSQHYHRCQLLLVQFFQLAIQPKVESYESEFRVFILITLASSSLLLSLPSLLPSVEEELTDLQSIRLFKIWV